MLHNHKKCLGCGKMFLEIRKSDLCPECLAQESTGFQRVKEYLVDYPGSTSSEITKFTGISELLIMKWYEDGRLEKSTIKHTKKCRICSRPIIVGEICKNCSDEMNKPASASSARDSVYVTTKHDK